MDIYQDCLLDNDLSGLIISGSATEDHLKETWNNIYTQSCSLQQSNNYNEVFELNRSVNDIRAKITIANNIIKHLQLSFDQELVDILNSLALMCDITAEDKGPVLVSKLNSVIAYMKKWFPKLELKEKELEELRKSNTGKADRAYFDNWFEIISEEKGYQVEASKTTVSRFYLTMNKITEKAMATELKNKVHGR